MRHSATRSLLERDDVIIVASVSCIYGIGAVETYAQMVLNLGAGQRLERKALMSRLVELQYKRNDQAFARGNFRVRGDSLEIFPSHYEDTAWRVSRAAVAECRRRSISSLIEESFSMNVSLDGMYASGW